MDEKELFMKKFEEKLKNQLDEKTLEKMNKGDFESELKSIDYEEFRRESLSVSMSKYEKACDFFEKTIPIKPDKKTEEKIRENLFNAHLNCTPTGVQSFNIAVSLTLMILGLSILLINGTIGFGIVIIGVATYFITGQIPGMLAKRTKAKASDEIIISIFYIVAFMRFNSNFELAINFAANYLNPPLALDFKRMLWELENSKYPNIKRAMDHYLEGWRDDNLEFLEAIYLIESSLYESDNARRISLLDKALDIILQGNYEKMLHYAQELRGKVSAFNMIGIVLPILGLIILPLAASMGDPRTIWAIVVLLYNIIIPAGVAYFGFMLIFNRPSTVNSIKTPNLKNIGDLQKYQLKISKNKTIALSPKVPAFTVFGIFLFLGLLPPILHMTGMETGLNNYFAALVGNPDSAFGYFQEYRDLQDSAGNSYKYGPYGTYPGLLSLFLPLSIAFGVGYYLKYKYQNLIQLRDKTKKLEIQFPSAAFQLGNRINEGISAELAFGAVAETMKGTEAGEFFKKIDYMVKFEGMSIEKAIFDKEKGAINEYPSELIVSSMKIVVHAIEKGPEITATTLLDLSRYLSEIHLGGERMKDLLAESIGSMKSQANFLAPIISAVVISIISLITLIMSSLADTTKNLGDSPEGLGNFLGESIPTYLFQGTVGIYVVFTVAILVYIVTNLENGEDPILTKYSISKSLISGMMKYAGVVAIGVVGFTYVGSKVLPALT